MRVRASSTLRLLLDGSKDDSIFASEEPSVERVFRGFSSGFVAAMGQNLHPLNWLVPRKSAYQYKKSPKKSRNTAVNITQVITGPGLLISRE